MKTAPIGLLVLSIPMSFALAQGTDCPEQRLEPVPQVARGVFGSELAMNDRHLIVGDPRSDVWCGGDPSCGKGAAYAYTYDGARGEWVFLDFIFPDDIAEPGGGFGPDVSLHEDLVIIGSSGVERLGGAYVFEFEDGSWVQRARLLPPAGTTRAPWGHHVAIWGDRAVVGNAGEDVLFFVNGAEGWQLVADMSSPDMPVGRSDFGDALDIDDRWLAIGAYGEKIFGDEHGAVYLYRLEGEGEPIYTQKLLPPRPTETHRFGYSVAIDGDTLVVGANLSDRGTSTTSPEGAAFVYEFRDGLWELVDELEAAVPKPAGYFGSDVDVLGDVIAVGSQGDLSDDQWTKGIVELFERGADGSWLRRSTIRPTVRLTDEFGRAVGLSSQFVACGAPDTEIDGLAVGAVDLYELDCLHCRPDLDLDDTLTIFDFLLFFNLFQDGDAQADFDGDGELTALDFLAFQTAFDAGC
ncbi:MAG: FG-GAP repeat protein [Phycisphaerales bacterium]